MSTTFSLQSATSFSHAISHKLTNLNYLLWCQQVEPMLKGHHFHHFFRSPTIPARFKTLEDHDLYNVSLESIDAHLTCENNNNYSITIVEIDFLTLVVVVVLASIVVVLVVVMEVTTIVVEEMAMAMVASIPSQAHIATVAPMQSSNWYLDSRTSHHVTNVSQNIQQLAPFEGDE
ncbi:hypothetical protein JHK82_040303 [Glycine max]|nr:hypothetical protein JHK82_040303 [Glycine max]